MRTYENTLAIAKRIPNALLAVTTLPLVIQPSVTIKQVFTWPTTVLLTGPAPATMKNIETLIEAASAPLYEKNQPAGLLILGRLAYQKNQ